MSRRLANLSGGFKIRSHVLVYPQNSNEFKLTHVHVAYLIDGIPLGQVFSLSQARKWLDRRKSTSLRDCYVQKRINSIYTNVSISYQLIINRYSVQ